jgi:Fe2+ or Zn2+ uptake regulation protein
MTFSELKKIFIKNKEMNLATLYRIIDAFKDQGLIHEIELDGERTFFLCQCMDRAEKEK